MKPIPDLSCPAYAELVNAVLDRAAPIEMLDHPHGQTCQSCRSLSAAAQLILTGATKSNIPSGLAQRIVSAALAERRIRQYRQRRVRAFTVVAILLIGVVSFSVWRQGDNEKQTIVAKIEPIEKLKPTIVESPLKSKLPRLEGSISEASNAIVAMTDDMTSPALFTNGFHVPTKLPEWTPAEANSSLVNLPSAASTGIEPITIPTRRAFKLFIRDTGLDKETKSKF